MLKTIVSHLLIASMLFYACGCVATKAVSMGQYEKEPKPGITSLVLTDGTVVEFNSFQRETGRYVNGEIVGIVRSGEKVHIPVAQVRSVSYNDSQASNTTILVCGALIGVAVIGYWAATWTMSPASSR